MPLRPLKRFAEFLFCPRYPAFITPPSGGYPRVHPWGGAAWIAQGTNVLPIESSYPSARCKIVQCFQEIPWTTPAAAVCTLKDPL